MEKDINKIVEDCRQLSQEEKNSFLLNNVNNKGMVEFALFIGADPNSNDNLALCNAVENGNVEVVKLLFDFGADVYADNNYLLRIAIENGHIEIVKLLLDKCYYTSGDIHTVLTKFVKF